MAKQNKLDQIKKLIDTAHISLEGAREILAQIVGNGDEALAEVADRAKELGKVSANGDEKIIEGIFDGQHMLGPDGKQYSIPANYASKSKLVVGDTLKLTIKPDGSFLYKQIGPVERGRLVGILTKDETTDEYRVIVGEKAFKVLLASITYFKGEPGDEVVVLVPKAGESDWAAVENIIKEAGETAQTATLTPGAETPHQPLDAHVEDIEEIGSQT
ncbi:MAG: hypothetical protein PHY34_02035 [Patescibacteria group bacterium]|nr:hypothetical protein [Patescibacteria group bacterium]MDD5715286.1 hypothetical protein [Patescibacteria group bacterium]